MAANVPALTGPELAIVVPVLNERANIRPLVGELSNVLQGIDWEVIFVDDDSKDGTADEIRKLAAEDRRVRCLQRIGRRGLSSACIEGMLASSAPYVAVMDGDLQHDPGILTRMLDELRTSGELAVGSRYVQGGGFGDWDQSRRLISRVATRLGRRFVPANLKDPMSGFFMLRRSLLDSTVRNLSGLGFKILVDLVASAPRPLQFKEVPFQFRTRQAGDSKLDSMVAWEYLMLLADKLIGRYVPVRFVSFLAVGTFGLFVHLAVVALLHRTGLTTFMVGQSIATGVAMVVNYTLNNQLTYRDQRRRGLRWLQGLLSFTLVCAVGSFANVGVASWLFGLDTRWHIAAAAGVLVGSVWNYAVTSVYTWGGRSR